jgi:hypothetical protein
MSRAKVSVIGALRLTEDQGVECSIEVGKGPQQRTVGFKLTFQTQKGIAPDLGFHQRNRRKRIRKPEGNGMQPATRTLAHFANTRILIERAPISSKCRTLSRSRVRASGCGYTAQVMADRTSRAKGQPNRCLTNKAPCSSSGAILRKSSTRSRSARKYFAPCCCLHGDAVKREPCKSRESSEVRTASSGLADRRDTRAIDRRNFGDTLLTS